MIYLSLGLGTQSSALLVMSQLGLRGCPRASAAIFADTQCEPAWVYDQLEVLRAWSQIPIHVVTAGNLAADVMAAHNGTKRRFAAIPCFTTGQDGKAVPLRRQCTRDYKIDPIQKKVRELMGYIPRQRIKGHATALIGISLDEASRMKPSREKWITNVYPLVEANMRRGDCERLLREHGLPVPKKSACVFCPYHNDEYWQDLKANHAEEFEKACAADEDFRNMTASGISNPVYLHRTLHPLAEVDFAARIRKRTSLPLFDEECEGVCGV